MNKMKKLLALMLALLMTFSLVACGGGDDAADTGDSAQTEIIWWAFPTFGVDSGYEQQVADAFMAANPDIKVTVEIIDLQAERYVSQNVLYRYNLTSVITVSSQQVELVRNLIAEQGELLDKGIAIVSGEYDTQVNYLFTGLNDLKPDMIAEATRNAREAAEQFASDSDSKLGKIKTATQGQFSISDRDQYTPYLKNVRVVTSVVYYLKD
jgi:hypothetical protein